LSIYELHGTSYKHKSQKSLWSEIGALEDDFGLPVIGSLFASPHMVELTLSVMVSSCVLRLWSVCNGRKWSVRRYCLFSHDLDSIPRLPQQSACEYIGSIWSYCYSSYLASWLAGMYQAIVAE
jgi:hypothetical protein